MGVMLPKINGVPVQIYSIPTTSELHEWRNKYKNREDSYTLLKTTKAQPYFFNAEDLRIREGLGYMRSLGYMVMAAHSLKQASISPAPDGSSWVNYRFKFKVEENWKDRWLKVVEARPRSPLNGDFRLWYIYFDEDYVEDNLPTEESTIETRGSEVGDMIIERVVEHNVYNLS
jgi:hypothetical protein